MFQLFHLSPEKPASLQQQLREQIAAGILNGNIPLKRRCPRTEHNNNDGSSDNANRSPERD
jgi:hypothetical protein